MAASNTVESPWDARIRPAMDLVQHKLTAMSPNRKRFVFQWTDGKSEEFFQIAEKADPGVKFGDPQHGKNWKTYHGPTRLQLETIERTSRTVAEIADRVIDFTLYGKDTTRMVNESQLAPQVSRADIEKMVAERVQQILADQRLASALVEQKATPQEVAAFDPPKLPAGLRKPKPRQNLKAAREAEIAVTKERCKLMGVDESTIQIRWDGSISKTWLKGFNAAWEKHSSGANV